jgi:hypothetical protein
MQPTGSSLSAPSLSHARAPPSNLFRTSPLQVAFRQTSRQAAELLKLEAQKKIDEAKVQSSLVLNKASD